MGSGAVMNYQGVADSGLEVIEGPNGEVFMGVYNDLAGVAANGECFFLSFVTDLDAQSQFPTLDIMATSTFARRIGVVIPKSGLDDIADTAYGFLQTRGFVGGLGALTSGTPADEAFLQGTDAVRTLIVDGSLSADSMAIAKAARVSSANVCVFFGETSLIG